MNNQKSKTASPPVVFTPPPRHPDTSQLKPSIRPNVQQGPRPPMELAAKQTKAQILEHAMTQITTQHVRQVLPFYIENQDKTKQDGKDTKKKSPSHTPAQLRVMSKKRERTKRDNQMIRNRPRKMDEVRRQSLDNRMRSLNEYLLPVSYNSHIKL